MKNILMIVVDDLRPEINCFGKNKLKTLNIDQLAKSSARYTQAYCQYPQCMPSRVSLMLGMRVGGPCYWSRELCSNGEVTLPAHLKQNGLTTISALSKSKQRECIHAYWACVSFMDVQVGRLLDALEKMSRALCRFYGINPLKLKIGPSL